MHGPLGMRRTATTRVTSSERPTTMTGTAELSGGTRARVTWSFTPDGRGTTVRLAAALEKAGPLDRALLAIGGRAWFRRRLAAILAALADRFRRQAPG
jgi:Polyketide cyclase / dehydrase and lipid transport